jgi:hypothetical protein
VPPDRAERRPAARGGAPDDALGGDTTHSIATHAAACRSQSCPWLRGAQLTGDPAAVHAALYLHSPSRCPAARRAVPHAPVPDDVEWSRSKVPVRLHRFGEPSNYSLSRAERAELAEHARQLRRDGWQPWELRVRFGLRDAA